MAGDWFSRSAARSSLQYAQRSSRPALVDASVGAVGLTEEIVGLAEAMLREGVLGASQQGGGPSAILAGAVEGVFLGHHTALDLYLRRRRLGDGRHGRDGVGVAVQGAVDGRVGIEDLEALEVAGGLGVLAGELQVDDVGAIGVAHDAEIDRIAADVRQLLLEDADGGLRVAVLDEVAALRQGGLHSKSGDHAIAVVARRSEGRARGGGPGEEPRAQQSVKAILGHDASLQTGQENGPSPERTGASASESGEEAGDRPTRRRGASDGRLQGSNHRWEGWRVGLPSRHQ